MYEFDLKTLLQTIKKSKKILIRNAVIALFVGAIIGFSIPKEYSSSCTLAPETQEEGMSGGLSSLASMAGINIGGGTDAIGPDLYPDVVASNNFIVDLLYINVETIDNRKISYLDHLRKDTRKPWWSFVKVGFAKLMKAINPQPKFTNSAGEGERINPERMSREDEMLLKNIKGAISCSVSDLDNTISITVRDQDPLVAKLVVDSAAVHLQNFITSYRTSKARIDLDYYRKLEGETHNKYIRTMDEYARYCDTHNGAILQSYISEQERLENEMQIALDAYTQIRKQSQMAEAKVQEKTPAFTLVDASTVPNKHDSPRKIMIMISCIFVTVVGTLGWIYTKLLFFTKKKDEE